MKGMFAWLRVLGTGKGMRHYPMFSWETIEPAQVHHRRGPHDLSSLQGLFILLFLHSLTSICMSEAHCGSLRLVSGSISPESPDL